MPKHGNKRRLPRNSLSPSPLRRWPPAPVNFSPLERSSWKRIGRAALLLGTVGAPDLILLSRLAQLSAKIDETLTDPEAKATTLAAMMRLEADLLSRCGMSPAGRNSVVPLSRGQGTPSALDEF